MIDAIILDDEEFGRETLSDLLSDNCPEVNIVAKYSSGKEALRAIETNKFQLLFLDIEMPQMDGFEFLNKIGDIDFDVIFTTSQTNAASKAFRVSATDFLLKPIKAEELKDAVDKVLKRQRNYMSKEQIEFLFHNLQNNNKAITKIALPTMQGLEFLDVNTIVYCAADNNYTNLHFTDGQKMLVSKTLKDIQESLPSDVFFRVHQSYLVNLQKIKKYVKGDGGYLVMDDGTTVTVARSKKDSLLKLF